MDQIHILSIIYIAIFLIQAFFHFYYFFPFTNRKKELEPRSEGKRPVSVIICAHNELENLQDNLPEILHQKKENFEVIVVNDRSEDGSTEWLRTQAEMHSHLNVIHIAETDPNYNPKKYALTKGIEGAKHEIILLTDADCRPASQHWVDRMSQSFTDKKSIILGASLYKRKKGFLNQFIRFETLHTALLYLSFASKKEAYMGVGRNLAYKRSLFLAKGGFKKISHIMGGDDDLWVNKHSTKENTGICTHPESITFSNPENNWSSFFKQKKRHLSVGKYYRTKDKLKLGVYHFTQTLVWILFILSWVLGSPTDCLILSFLFLLFLIGQYVVFYKLSIKFGIRFMHYNLPILEILFIGYFWIWGIYASLTKHLKWK